jgi:hypothetical protein
MTRPDIKRIFEGIPGYSLKKITSKPGIGIFYDGKLIARCFLKNEFYGLLEEFKVNWQQIPYKHFSPVNALHLMVGKTLFIIELKYNQSPEYVYHKLQPCDFKRKQYLKLVTPLGLKVEYVYVLNDWFKKPEYKDVLDYIQSVNCHYRFNELPLAWLGLPT